MDNAKQFGENEQQNLFYSSPNCTNRSILSMTEHSSYTVGSIPDRLKVSNTLNKEKVVLKYKLFIAWQVFLDLLKHLLQIINSASNLFI